jgi:hypothetical protein
MMQGVNTSSTCPKIPLTELLEWKITELIRITPGIAGRFALYALV